MNVKPEYLRRIYNESKPEHWLVGMYMLIMWLYMWCNCARFKINSSSGAISLAGALDRETVAHYLLTVEATDGGGRTAFANLNVTVLDVNDVKPAFLREEYYVTVREDKLTFVRGILEVKVWNMSGHTLLCLNLICNVM